MPSQRRPPSSRKRERDASKRTKKPERPEKLLARLYRAMPADAKGQETPFDEAKRRKKGHKHHHHDTGEKYTTRGINALEFLRSVPLEAESRLVNPHLGLDR